MEKQISRYHKTRGGGWGWGVGGVGIWSYIKGG